MTPLAAYLTRYLDGLLESSLKGPVLVIEPPRKPGETNEEYQFRTSSGVGTPTPGHSETCVLEVRKQKNNAFQRGVTLGRTRNNDLVIQDGSVSRFHAWFHLDAELGKWCVADAGSKNGTKLGSRRLTAKKPVALTGGEKLRFGKVEALFLLPPGFTKFLRARLA